MSSATSAKTTNEQSDAKQQPTKGNSLSDSLLLVVLDRLKDIFGPMLEKQTAEIIKKVADCQGDIQKLTTEVKRERGERGLCWLLGLVDLQIGLPSKDKNCQFVSCN